MLLTIKMQNSGEVIASGKPHKTVQVFEGNWYFAPEAVDMKYLKVTNHLYTCSYKGQCFWIDLEAPGVHVPQIAWVYRNPKPGYEFIKDQIGFYARNTPATLAINGL
jgi:uncharacterized protein (DUF427 family)